MNARTLTATITVTLDLNVAGDVDDGLLCRYLDKAIDNGIDMGLGDSIGVTVLDQATDIQL